MHRVTQPYLEVISKIISADKTRGAILPQQNSPRLRFQNLRLDLSKKVRKIRCILLTFFDCVSLEVLHSRNESIFEMTSSYYSIK